MNTNIKKIIIIILIIYFSLNSNVIRGYTSLLQYLDYENLNKINQITATYLISKNEKTALEIIIYDFSTFIITENASGEFCNGYFKLKLRHDFTPISLETKYFSSFENSDYDESYKYYQNYINYKNNKKNISEKISISPNTADAIFLLELIVFSKLIDSKDIEAEAMIVPNHTKLGFIFKYIRDETVEINGKAYDTLLYEARVTGLAGFFVALFGGTAQLWILKDFPHLRVKTIFFQKKFSLQSYNVSYKD